jgi:predicted DNA-binding ribbon-helix-helix protein
LKTPGKLSFSAIQTTSASCSDAAKRPNFFEEICKSFRKLLVKVDMTRPEKHSLTLHGHRTSVSLEPEFWDAFRELAARQRKTLNELAAQIDATRGDVGLASAIRVFILRALQG